MPNGWTGGQYSLARAALGASVAASACMAHWGVVATGLALAAAAALAIGWLDRVAALVLAFEWLLLMDPAAGREIATTAMAALFLIHAAQPRAPYGSWDARGRVDPGGGWTYRPFLLAIVRVLLALTLVASWREHVLAPLPLVTLCLFAFDPAWVPRLDPGALEMLFYDGTCGLCHRAVRFLLAEDPDGAAFRFAPLGGEAFAARLAEDVRARLPDSLVLLTADGRVLTRSAAARRAMARLGGIWRVLATALRVVPAGLLDAVYDGIARIRYRLFARPKDACPILPPHLRARFSA
jgi:predicted DCC family thiol-disulfide oxidoreductase YuxK